MSSTVPYPSALRPPPLRLGMPLLLALGLHAAVALGLVVGAMVRPSSRPMIDPDEVLEVSLMPMAKQTTALPQKATRTPDPVVGTPEPTPQPPLPPSNSDLALNDPEAPQKQGDERAQSREELMEQLRREQARKDALAALGNEDRARTDPDGVEGATGTSAGLGDPKKAAYAEKVRQAILPNLGSLQKDPNLKVLVDVTIDADGRIVEWKIRTPSGDSSYDAAVQFAIQKTRQVPPPPAEIFGGAPPYTLPCRFSPKDSL